MTKAHGLYFDGVLIPVEFLVNHRTILWDDIAREVTIYHIELETHDIILANGTPAETYRDDGKRWLFHNANTGWHLPPQQPCAPVLTGGPLVDAVWRRLLDRAGPSRPPAHRRCRPSSTRGRPAGRGPRTDRPHPRILSARGAIEPEHRIAISQGARFRTIDASDERLDDGFHAFEAAEGYRWTDGLASLPTDIFADITGPFEVALSIGATASYLEYTDRRHVA